jgi:membrane protease YdiL (CAAX protease family)
VTDVPPSARSDARLAVWLGFILLFIALQYESRASGPPPQDTLYRWETFAAGLVQFFVTMAIVLGVAWNGPVREFLALRRPASVAVAGGLAVLVFVGVVLMAGLLEPAAPFAANFVLAAALFPIAEELLFRGAGFAVLSRFGRVAAIIAVGILFGLAHGLVNALPILAAFGIALAWLRAHTRSVLPCIALHSFFNAFALLGSVLTWSRL